MIYQLPPWMLPEGFNRNRDDKHCNIVNPKANSAIFGEGGDQMGRGGRASVYFVDEAAYVERPERIDSAMSRTTRVRIDVSTPNGIGNPFYQKRFSGNYDVFTFHWKSDPRKTQEWYNAFLKEKGPTITAEQLDIDYTASLEGIFIPGPWVRAAIDLDLPESDYISSGFDVAEEGNDLCVVINRRGPVVRMEDIISWGKTETTESAWKARDFLVKSGSQEVNYDTDGVGTGIKGTWNSAQRDQTEGAKTVPFIVNPIHAGGACGEDKWPDGLTSKEKFSNLKAEMWWKLRVRFEKTYEWVHGNKDHPTDELISIPAHPELVAELSMPKLEHAGQSGKIMVEKKDSMKKRGLKSPNYADALILAFYKKLKKVFWIK